VARMARSRGGPAEGRTETGGPEAGVAEPKRRHTQVVPVGIHTCPCTCMCLHASLCICIYIYIHLCIPMLVHEYVYVVEVFVRECVWVSRFVVALCLHGLIGRTIEAPLFSSAKRQDK